MLISDINKGLVIKDSWSNVTTWLFHPLNLLGLLIPFLVALEVKVLIWENNGVHINDESGTNEVQL